MEATSLTQERANNQIHIAFLAGGGEHEKLAAVGALGTQRRQLLRQGAIVKQEGAHASAQQILAGRAKEGTRALVAIHNHFAVFAYKDGQGGGIQDGAQCCLRGQQGLRAFLCVLLSGAQYLPDAVHQVPGYGEGDEIHEDGIGHVDAVDGPFAEEGACEGERGGKHDGPNVAARGGVERVARDDQQVEDREGALASARDAGQHGYLEEVDEEIKGREEQIVTTGVKHEVHIHVLQQGPEGDEEKVWGVLGYRADGIGGEQHGVGRISHEEEEPFQTHGKVFPDLTSRGGGVRCGIKAILQAGHCSRYFLCGAIWCRVMIAHQMPAAPIADGAKRAQEFW